MAPKSSGRIIPYEGLPPGWQAIEKDYLTGSMAGKSYIRFQNEKHKGVGSIRAALKLYATDNNMEPEQVIAEFDQQRETEKAKSKAQKEAKGFLVGEKRDEAVAHFRNTYGKLDGATICALPGWRGESKWLEKSQQICARYYAPDGQSYSLLLNIEAMFGVKLMNGEEIPDIEGARATLVTDEKGKVINVARRDNVLSDFTAAPERPAKKKKHTVDIAAESDYRHTEFLKVLRLRTEASSETLEEEKVADKEQVLQDAEQVHRTLVGRGFGSETELLYVTGSRNARTVGRKALDSLCGIYYQRPDEYCGRGYYQRVFTAENNSNALGCTGHFMCWSDSQQLWKLGQLFENKAGFAVCRQDKPHPADLDALWGLYEPRVEGADGGEGDGAENGAKGGDGEDSQNTNQDTTK